MKCAHTVLVIVGNVLDIQLTEAPYIQTLLIDSQCVGNCRKYE